MIYWQTFLIILFVHLNLFIYQTRTEAHNLFSYLRTRTLHFQDEASVLTANMPMELQVYVLNSFQNGNSKILVTTNILARGIDIPNCNYVLNFDLPRNAHREPDTKTYLYRVSRCGRFCKFFQIF